MNHILYSTASDADKSPKIDAHILGALEKKIEKPNKPKQNKQP